MRARGHAAGYVRHKTICLLCRLTRQLTARVIGSAADIKSIRRQLKSITRVPIQPSTSANRSRPVAQHPLTKHGTVPSVRSTTYSLQEHRMAGQDTVSVPISFGTATVAGMGHASI